MTDDVSTGGDGFVASPSARAEARAVAAGDSAHQAGKGMAEAAAVLRRVLPCSPRDVCTIPPGYSVPPRLEGTSALYVLRLPNGRFYVGESDAISTRLAQHRRRWGDALEALVVAASSKSAARAAESDAIAALQRAGFDLVSANDAEHVSFGSESVWRARPQ
ncbi:hypothetical protein JKP88DRAFT_235791 [Tribonema minus]|uniref:GIY-YIG domain-containing protein n=1 Tax=Tribonema minus TaxID=303371 RepID=A0A835Z641_9STRA|nr:hypothetical protein JKP88DRAFT_235791 [Tribonema minus]